MLGEKGNFINTGYIANAKLGKQIDVRIVAASRPDFPRIKLQRVLLLLRTKWWLTAGYCLASLEIGDDFSYWS